MRRLIAKKIGKRSAIMGVKGIGIEIEYMPGIAGGFFIYHGHMQRSGRDENNIPFLGLIGMGSAQIPDFPGKDNYQFIIIMIMQPGGIGFPVIIGAAIGIKQKIIDGKFPPVHDLRMLGPLKIQVMG